MNDPTSILEISAEDYAAALEGEVARAIHELAKARAAIAQAQREIAGLRSTVSERDQALAALAGELGEKVTPEVLESLRERYLVGAGNGSPTPIPEPGGVTDQVVEQ